MTEPAERQRTVLRAPRVEFDLSALTLGACGWLAYQWSWPMLAGLLNVPEVRNVPPWLGLKSVFWSRAFGWIGLPYTEYLRGLVGWPGDISFPPEKAGEAATAYDPGLPWWNHVVVAAWLLVLWSLVGGAISRVYAVRIARDESIGAGDGIAFALSNMKGYLLAPVFVALASGLFVGLVALAGAVSAVPGAGPYLSILMYPLALVAGLMLVLMAVGGVFGLPVMQAAISAERNGFLDAVSRTFSYVFTRPLAYVVSCGLVALVSGLILAFGQAFIVMTVRAFAFGTSWNADSAAPGGAGSALTDGVKLALSANGVMGIPKSTLAGGAAVWSYCGWAVTALVAILVNGYALSYFVGGLTDTYFLLRREVDGIDDGEVYVEGEDAALGEPLTGEPAKPTGEP